MRGCSLTLALLLAMSSTPTTPSGQPAALQAGEFQGSAPANIVTWQNKRLTPPSPLYVTVDDQINAAGASSIAGEVVTINYRLLRASDGKIVFGQFVLNLPTAYTVQRQMQALAEGFLLSTTVTASAAIARGQTYVRLFLNPATLGAGTPGFTLTADYTTQDGNPGHPFGRILQPTESTGAVVTTTITTPGLGADWTYTFPNHTRSRLMSIHANLLTSATVANRAPIFEVKDASGKIPFAMTSSTVQAASLNVSYNISDAFVIQPPIGTQQQIPIPHNYHLGSSFTILTVTPGLQGGDQWSSIVMLTEQWLDNV